MQQNIIQFFAKFIETELGIIYSDFNEFQLRNRLDEISKHLKLNSLEELYAMMQRPLDPGVKQFILDTATNNETSFFRDPKLFHALETSVLPAIVAKAKTAERPRVWSAACSSGQETYSIAMLLEEAGNRIGVKGPADIVATDISNRVLEKAKAGRYTQLEVGRGLTPALQQKYFGKQEELYGVSSELKARIKFESLNLLKPFDHLGRFDLILCRNVLIYQNVQKKAEILERLARSLRPGGYLVLGAGESMIGLSDSFEGVRHEECFLYRAKSAESNAA
jgi:chemotaxis protein methyltransferase CheR